MNNFLLNISPRRSKGGVLRGTPVLFFLLVVLSFQLVTFLVRTCMTAQTRLSLTRASREISDRCHFAEENGRTCRLISVAQMRRGRRNELRERREGSHLLLEEQMNGSIKSVRLANSFTVTYERRRRTVRLIVGRHQIREESWKRTICEEKRMQRREAETRPTGGLVRQMGGWWWGGLKHLERG